MKKLGKQECVLELFLNNIGKEFDAKEINIFLEKNGLEPSSQPARIISNLKEDYYIEGKGKHRNRKYVLLSNKKKPVIQKEEKINDNIKRIIVKKYQDRDIFTGSKLKPREFLLDHKVPRIRWGEDIHHNCSLAEEENLQLTNHSSNLKKSRRCEKCKKTGVRQKNTNNINFYYYGNETYDENVGCEGCYWFDPLEWSKKLNEKLDTL